MSDVRTQLKKLMELKGLTATRLARMSGVSQPGIAKILNGTARNPTIQTLLDLAAALDVSVLDLIPSGNAIKVINDEADPTDALYHKVPTMRPDVPHGENVQFALVPDKNVPGVAYEERWFEKHNADPKKVFQLEVPDHSMMPFFFKGDMVAIERFTPGAKVEGRKVYIFHYAGALHVKRLIPRINGSMTIRTVGAGNVHDESVPEEVFYEKAVILGRVLNRSGGEFL